MSCSYTGHIYVVIPFLWYHHVFINRRKSVKVFINRWKSVKVFINRLKSVKVFINRWKSVKVFSIVCLYLFCILRSNCQEGKCWDHINPFGPAILFLPAQPDTWISNTIYVVVSFCFKWSDVRGVISSCWY